METSRPLGMMGQYRQALIGILSYIEQKGQTEVNVQELIHVLSSRLNLEYRRAYHYMHHMIERGLSGFISGKCKRCGKLFITSKKHEPACRLKCPSCSDCHSCRSRLECIAMEV